MHLPRLAACAVAGTIVGLPAAADTPDRWGAPFGGAWHAFVTFATDYAQTGISSTQREPVLQAGLDYQTPYLLGDGKPPFWIYASLFGSNVSFPEAGKGVELDFSGGLKAKLMDRKLGLSMGYTRYTYPGIEASFGLEYGEVELKADYDFGPLAVSGRLRWSPAGLGGVGETRDKRALVSVPLTFLKLPFDASMKAYGAFGDMWMIRPRAIGLPTDDYIYWQVGLVTSVWGLDFTLAYTDTNIEPEGCGNTQLCAARLFFSVTKVF